MTLGIRGGPHTQNNNTVLRSVKDRSHIYQVLVHMLAKKHPHFYHTGTNTHADFVVTCLQAEMLNTQFQYFTIFADKK